MSNNVPDYCQVLKFTDSNGQVKQMIFPKALDLDRPKRPRTTFSDQQLDKLECEYKKNPYLIGKDRCRLAKDLSLTETQIKVWFQNRRTKSKKLKTSPPLEKSPLVKTLATFSVEYLASTDFLRRPPPTSSGFVGFSSAAADHIHHRSLFFPAFSVFN